MEATKCKCVECTTSRVMDITFERDLQYLVLTLCRILFNNVQERIMYQGSQSINQKNYHGDIGRVEDLNPLFEIFRTAKYLQFETITFNNDSSSTMIFNYQWDTRCQELNLNHLMEISKFHYQSFLPFLYKINRWKCLSLGSLTNLSILSNIKHYLPGFDYLYDFHWIANPSNLPSSSSSSSFSSSSSSSLSSTSIEEPNALFLASDSGIFVVVIIKRYCEDLMSYESSPDLIKGRHDEYNELVKNYKKYATEKHGNKLLTVIGATYTEDPSCPYPFEFVSEIDCLIAKSVQSYTPSSSSYQASRQGPVKTYDSNAVTYCQLWAQSSPTSPTQKVKMPLNPGKSAPIVGVDWVCDGKCQHTHFNYFNSNSNYNSYHDFSNRDYY